MNINSYNLSDRSINIINNSHLQKSSTKNSVIYKKNFDLFRN